MKRSNPLTAAAVLLVSLSVSTQAVAGATPTDCLGHNPTIVGTNAGETLTGTAGNDVILALGGRDLIAGNGGNDVICAGGGNDVLSGGPGGDILFGSSGNDRISGGPGNDEVAGEDGIDRLSYASARERVIVDLQSGEAAGGEGDDSITGVEHLTGSSFSDTLKGNDSAGNHIDGGDGNDRLFGGAGNDRLTAGAGDDSLAGGAGDDELAGGPNGVFGDYAAFDDAPGPVIANLGAAFDTGSGTIDANRAAGEGSDQLAGIESLSGSSFPDLLIGNGLGNTLLGGEEDDTLLGKGGADDLFGSRGNDTIAGGEDHDSIVGGDGDDDLRGDEGRDRLRGGDDDDLLNGGLGDDVMDGDDDVLGDTVSFAGSTRSVRANLGEALPDNPFVGPIPARRATGQGIDDLFEIENASGGAGNDFLLGTTTSNLLRGNLGNDRLWGFAGNDQLFGGDGADTMQGWGGDDLLDGGDNPSEINGASVSGRHSEHEINNHPGPQPGEHAGDRASWFFSQSTVTAVLTAGGPLGDGTATADDQGTDTLVGIESLEGGFGVNILVGDAGPNVLFGCGERDTLIGNGGNDVLLGYLNPDWLFGDQAPASEFPQFPADGAPGSDILYGHEESDRFSMLGGGNDQIFGGAGPHDLLDFRWASGSVTADLSGTFSGAGFSGAVAGTEWLDGPDFGSTLIGDGARNYINGGAGNDSLYGLGGNDILRGQGGTNHVDGGEGSDDECSTYSTQANCES